MFAFIIFNYWVPRHLGGHVGVDADGWEHGEVEEEVPACEENQGGCEGPVHKQDLDKHSHGKNHSKAFQRFRKFYLKGCQDDETTEVSKANSDGRSDVLLYRKSRVRVIMWVMVIWDGKSDVYLEGKAIVSQPSTGVQVLWRWIAMSNIAACIGKHLIIAFWQKLCWSSSFLHDLGELRRWNWPHSSIWYSGPMRPVLQSVWKRGSCWRRRRRGRRRWGRCPWWSRWGRRCCQSGGGRSWVERACEEPAGRSWPFLTWFDLQLQKTTRMEGFNSKCGHLEEKVNTGPLEQNQQLKDWMLKEVMLSFTMTIRLKESFFWDGTPLQFIVVLAPFEKICFMMESSQPLPSMEENGAKSRITRFPEPSHIRQASKKSWKFLSLNQNKKKITLPPKSLHKNPTIFGTQTGHHQDCRETERIYCENFFFIKRKPACAFQPIPSLALWAPFCCNWSFLLKHNGHLFSILFVIAMHFGVGE